MAARTIEAGSGSAGDGNDAPGGARTRRLTCPRCGYDVSGPVDTWAESCPVEGLCTECGLGFRWSDVFDPLRDVPRWFFELAPRRRVWAFPATWVRTLMPWRFWRDVTLSFPVRMRRLAVFVAFVAFGAWLFVATNLVLCQGLILRGFYSRGWVQQGGRWVQTPGTFSWDNVRGLLKVSLQWPRPDRWIPGAPEYGWVVVVLTVAVPAGFAVLAESLGRAKVRAAHVIRAAVYVATGSALVFCMVESVRPACTAYTQRLYWSGAFSMSLSVCDLLAGSSWISMAVLLPWTLLCWWTACRRYFRIEHPLWVALAMTTIGALLAIFLALMFTDAFTGLLMNFV